LDDCFERGSINAPETAELDGLAGRGPRRVIEQSELSKARALKEQLLYLFVDEHLDIALLCPCN